MAPERIVNVTIIDPSVDPVAYGRLTAVAPAACVTSGPSPSSFDPRPDVWWWLTEEDRREGRRLPRLMHGRFPARLPRALLAESKYRIDPVTPEGKRMLKEVGHGAP